MLRGIKMMRLMLRGIKMRKINLKTNSHFEFLFNKRLLNSKCSNSYFEFQLK